MGPNRGLQSLRQSLASRNHSAIQNQKKELKLSNILSLSEISDVQDKMRMPSIRENLLHQLDILKRQKIKSYRFHIPDTYKELYNSQQELLSTLNGHTAFPRSVAYSALKFENMERNGYGKHNIGGKGICQHQDMLELMKSNQLSYNKLLKGKLNRIPISKMSKEEVKDIFAAWYQTQKISETAEASLRQDHSSSSRYGRENFSAVNGNQLLEMKSTLIDRLPSRSRSLKLLISDEILTTKEWLLRSVEEIRYFHEVFDDRMKYIMETGIGRYELRSIVQQLKECCTFEKDIMNTDKSKRLHLNEQWINALKCYKAVRTCLISEAQNDTSCMFLSHH